MKLMNLFIWLNLMLICLVNPLVFNIVDTEAINSSFIQSKLSQDIIFPIDQSKLPEINYNTIYYEWYHPKAEMLIITPDNQSFIDAVSPLMDWKNKKGVKTIVLSNFSSYEGRDKAEKIRNMIKFYYNKENIQWVLLCGDATESLVPTRYVYNPDTIEYSGSEYDGYDDYYKPTDFYYADLTDTWDKDGDGKWGESSKYNAHGKDEIDWIAEVYAGRLPACNARELETMVNKIINYEKNPSVGDWMNKMLLAGGISSYSPAEDETRLTTHIIQNYIPSNMNYTHLCEYTSSYIPPDPKDPLYQNIFVNNFNLGFSTVFFAGHGNPFRLIRNPSEDEAYTNSDANVCNNLNMASLIYAFACTTSPFDKNDNNLGEILIKRNNSGVIGYIGGMRITWYFEHDTKLEKLNRGNAKLFWREFFEEKNFQQGKALYNSKIAYMNSDYFDNPSVSMRLEYERKNVLTYCLLGDPELDVYTNKPVVVSNPFPGEIFEGQNLSITIKNTHNEFIPNARLSITSNDGLYRSLYTDSSGQCNFIIPALEKKDYNFIITGHNIIPSQFNFKTQLDTVDPEIINLQMRQEILTGNETIQFTAEGYDLCSGIENIFILLSRNEFKDFSILVMEKDSSDNIYTYNLFKNNIKPGKYSYLAIARDFANNTKIFYEESCNFEVIDENLRNSMEIVYFLAFLLIIGIIGISFFLIYRNYKRKEIKKREWELTAIRIRKKERMEKLRKKKQLN
ncbi:MAG: C25 family cysteine peptidase [Promethearchaeota archaeon]